MKSREQEEREAWSNISQFVAQHPIACKDARFIRAMVNWWPGLGDWALGTRIGRAVTWCLPPMWFAARILLCVKCQTIEFESTVARSLFHRIGRYWPAAAGEGHEHGMYFFGEDVEFLTDKEKEEFQIVPLEDPI